MSSSSAANNSSAGGTSSASNTATPPTIAGTPNAGSSGLPANNAGINVPHVSQYPQVNSLVFVVNPLPSTEEQLNERILEAANRDLLTGNSTNSASQQPPPASSAIPTVTETGSANHESLPPKPVNVSQCVISNGYVAVLLEDNRIYRFPYNIYPERSSGNNGEASQAKSTLASSNHRLNSPSNSNLVSSSSARTVQTARRRLIRSSSTRPRTSASVIMGRSHVIPAQFVPEDLINQAQVVLQGKSRNVIIRELQRTNLDVNLAVNNLLSRDDEEFDDGDDGPEQMIQSDDLMSLLDSGFPNESVIIDSDFADEVFSYPLRIRSSSALFNGQNAAAAAAAAAGGTAPSGSAAAGTASGSQGSTGASPAGSSGTSSLSHRPSRLRDDAFSFIERDLQLSSSGGGSKSRWYSYNTIDPSKADLTSSRSSKNAAKNAANLADANSNLTLAPIAFYEQQREAWPNPWEKKFVAIAAIYSELIALTSNGQLCQWRWADAEPFQGQLSDGTLYYHPKVPSLGLLQEKVTLLSASCIRATVATESGKLATWIDESIAPLATKLEHPATSSIFTEASSTGGAGPGGASNAANANAAISPPLKITALLVSSLMSCVQWSNGALYWWGIPPFSHRKKLVEKVKNERSKSTKSSKSTTTSNSNAGTLQSTGTPSKESNEIVMGSLVCLRNSPIYQAGSIAFTTAGDVPKVGQLVNSAWKMTDSCSFRILSQAEIQSRTQSSGATVLSLSSSNNRSGPPPKDSLSVVDSKCEMPPPPSPASSTSSEPGYNPPLPKRAKRSSASGTSSTASGQSSSQGDREQGKDNLCGMAIERVELWNLKDVVFMEDVKNMPIGRVIKVDGNYVAVKFNHGAVNDPAGSKGTSDSKNATAAAAAETGGIFDFTFENFMQDCRLMRKDELSAVKSPAPSSASLNTSASGQTTLASTATTCPSAANASLSGSKSYDCLQRYPKRVHIPEHVQILAMTLTNLGLHCIAKIGGYRFSYLLVNIVTGRIESDSKISIEYSAFFGANSKSLIKLFSAGETDSTTVVICRDGNGTLYPLAKDCTETVIREPFSLNLGPVSTIGLGICALPGSMMNHASLQGGSNSNAAPKTHAAILGLAFEPQLLMSAILKSDLDLVRERLDLLERFPHIYHPMIAELCDGNHNILHIAVSACSPTSNKASASGTTTTGTTAPSSGSILNIFENDEVMPMEQSPEQFSSNASNEPFTDSAATYADSIAEPLLDPTEQKPIAHSILWTLLDSHVLAEPLLDLLSARDFQGYTPFMLAVAGRAYSAANQLFLIIQRVARHYAASSSNATGVTGPVTGSSGFTEAYKRTLAQMLYPRGSQPDHSPLYMLCSNDTCSFTWTGEEHINQDIFECRTCGLVGSLCCCTECARVCHRGHDCKLKRTSPTAYCDCWEKCKCKALISGCQPARYLLLKRLLTNTDLSLRVNSRGEHLLLFLVQTVGRQIGEQKQYRPPRLRGIERIAAATRNKADAATEEGSNMPDHDLEPPKFTRRALEKMLGDWQTVKSMILTGYRAPDSKEPGSKKKSYLCGFFNGTSNAYAYEEENAYLGRQNGSALLDKFTHSLLRIGLEMIERLIGTLLGACNNQLPEARTVARRFVRSVARVGLVVCFELNPNLYASLTPSTASGFISLMDRALGGAGTASGSSSTSSSSSYSSSSSVGALSRKNHILPVLGKCRRIFLSFLPLAIEELAEIAESLIVPVKMGVSRPSGAFVLESETRQRHSTANEVLASTDEIFSVDTSIYAHQRDFLDSAFGMEGGASMEEGGGGGSASRHAPPPIVVPAPNIPAVPAVVPPASFVGAFGGPSGVGADGHHHQDHHQDGAGTGSSPDGSNDGIEPMETSQGAVQLQQARGGVHQPGDGDLVSGADDASLEQPLSMDGSEADGPVSRDGAYHRRDDMVSIGDLLRGDDEEEHDEENSNAGGRDSESDSESNPDDASYLSNADNASMAQRSVVTGATAGSDVGVSSLPYDDESINSNGEDVDDDDEDEGEADENEDDEEENSDASDTAETENEADDLPFLDEAIDPRNGRTVSSLIASGLGGTTSATREGGSSRSNMLHHVQWALRQRDLGGSGSSATSAAQGGESGFRRAVSAALVPGESLVNIGNSSIGLSRAFSIVIRQIGDLMPVLRNPSELTANHFPYLAFTPLEAMALQNTVEERLRNTWEWLITTLDSTETQLRFGCALSNRRLTSTAVSSSLSSSASSSAVAAASLSSAVAFSNSAAASAAVGANASSAASNSLRRLRAFQNHDDMLFLPSLSRTTSALRRMSGLGIGSGSGRGSTSAANGGTASGATSGGAGAASGVGASGTGGSAGLAMDSASCRRDFLHYAMSLMRAHSNEHYDSLPILDVSSLKHLAYVFDAFIYYIRRGLPAGAGNGQYQSTAEQDTAEYSLEQSFLTGEKETSSSVAAGHEASLESSSAEVSATGRGSRFFRRSNSTLYLGCPPPDPFSAPFHEALPLASKPHLLQPNARREQLFGVPRPSNAKQAEQMIESLPSQMSLTRRTIPGAISGHSMGGTSANSTPLNVAVTRNQSVIAETTISPSRSSIIQTPTKQSVIVLAGSAKHQASQPTAAQAQAATPETQSNSSFMCSVIAKAAQYNAAHADTKPLMANHYYGNKDKHDALLGRWRLSLELFGRLFVDDVGLEPNSIMGELSGFPIKESKFRREMERLRNPVATSSSSSSNTQRDISFLKLDREHGALLQQTFKELNAVFQHHARRVTTNTALTNSHLAVTRVKVTFKDEPGEGSGVARSFYTAFSEAALANEKLPLLEWTAGQQGVASSSARSSSANAAAVSGSSSWNNYQYNLFRVANGTISAAVASALAGNSTSASSGTSSASASAATTSGTASGRPSSHDDRIHRPRSPGSRFRLFTTRRSHIERIRNELRSGALGSGSSSSGGASGASTSGSAASASSSRPRNNSGPVLRYESAPFVPTQQLQQQQANHRGFSSSAPALSSDSRITLGHRIYGRVYPLHPNHAPKITGMLLDLPSHDLIALLTSDEQFRLQVDSALEIITSTEGTARPGAVSGQASGSSVPPLIDFSGIPVEPPSVSQPSQQQQQPPQAPGSQSGSTLAIETPLFHAIKHQSATGSSSSSSSIPPTATAADVDLEEEDNAPLFYQPGPRGFYSPRAGRSTEPRLNAFRNIGRIIGICFVQNELCPITLNRHVIKVILGRPVYWHDLAFFDSDLYESLRQLILDAESANREEIFTELDFRFAIDVASEEGGAEVELIPNGRNIRVTPANVFNYVRLYALYRMVISQLSAIQALRAGIFDVLPSRSFEGLTAEDFRLLLNGVNEINVALLQSYVTFHDESGDGSEHLSYFRRWFWWVVERMSNEEKQDLIYFWTGSPALPASEEGFQPMPSITIRPRDDYYFVTANTCISRLYIPLYSSRNILRQKLLISIKAKSFGFI